MAAVGSNFVINADNITDCPLYFSADPTIRRAISPINSAKSVAANAKKQLALIIVNQRSRTISPSHKVSLTVSIVIVIAQLIKMVVRPVTEHLKQGMTQP